MTPKRMQQVLVVYALFIVVVMVHFPVLLNGLINWNDDELFFAMHAVHTGHATIFTQEQHAPALLWWYGLQYAIGGNGYFIYHAVSLLLHAANVLLLFGLLQRFGLSLLISAASATLFAVHPVHTGTVAMVSHQPVLLTMLFLQMMLYAYERRHTAAFILWNSVVLLFVVLIALLGAPSLLPVGAILLFHGVHQRTLKDKTTLAVGAVAAAGWIILGVQQGWWASVWPLFRESVAMMQYGFAEQMFRIILPWDADLLSPTLDQITSAPEIGRMLVPFFSIAVITTAVLQRREHPLFFLCVMTILGSSLPLVTGWSRGEWIFSEQWSYIASAAWAVLIVYGVVWIAERQAVSAVVLKGVAVMVVLLTIGAALQTFVKSGYWRDGETFWAHCLEERPDDLFARTKKGMFHYFQFEYDAALKELNEAVRLAPRRFDVVYSRAVVNLGAMYLPEATRDYQMALELDPRSSNVYFGMGSIHSLYSRYDSAVTAFSEAIRLSPGFYEAYTNRGTVYANMGNFVHSFADFEKARRLSPKFGQIYGNRSLVFLQTGNAVAAANDLQYQLELEPFNVTARIHAGLTAVLMKDTSLAMLQFSKAWEIDSQRTKLYLTGAKQTFFKTLQEQRLGEELLRRSIGTF